MSVTVRLAAPLRAAAGGNTTLSFDVTDLPELARAIADRYPELAARVLRDGEFGRFVNVFIDGEDARFLAQSDLQGKRTVEILPAMSGGAVAPLPERARRDEHEVFGSFIDETIGIVARQTRDTVSFAVGSPSHEALDLVGADDLAATVISREGAKALGYGITEGEPELRDVIAASARDRGVAAEASEVLVSAGALQAIDLACRVYLRSGDVVVAESPAFANAHSAFRNHGARVLEVPVDSEGLDVAEAARRIRRLGVRPRMFFVVPNFQNPTGETLSLERREAHLAHLLRRRVERVSHAGDTTGGRRAQRRRAIGATRSPPRPPRARTHRRCGGWVRGSRSPSARTGARRRGSRLRSPAHRPGARS
jgi:molybdopterin converting factor small subunit